jgi:hypothetical protein
MCLKKSLYAYQRARKKPSYNARAIARYYISNFDRCLVISQITVLASIKTRIILEFIIYFVYLNTIYVHYIYIIYEWCEVPKKGVKKNE